MILNIQGCVFNIYFHVIANERYDSRLSTEYIYITTCGTAWPVAMCSLPQGMYVWLGGVGAVVAHMPQLLAKSGVAATGWFQTFTQIPQHAYVIFEEERINIVPLAG